MPKLQVGDRAPHFTLPDQHGTPVALADLIGTKHLVLFFYPKDETPGCTIEACAFRDSYQVFQDAGAEVVGISSDSVASHLSFAQNRNLPYRLLSDADGAIRKMYDVQPSMLGLLPGRETFLIDKDGIIRHRFASQIMFDRHIDEALKHLQAMIVT
ncbi:MAG: peroxiredoxin [Bacteroidia bacterium]